MNIGLIAHDNRKETLLEWVDYNKGSLNPHHLISTGTTGLLIERATNLPVEKLHSGPLGGDQEMGAKIANGEIDYLFFFWDPAEPHPHDVDIKALLRLSVIYNIPTACSRATADFMISSPLFGNEDYQRELTDFSAYIQRIK